MADVSIPVEYAVTLKVDQNLTFNVEGARDASDAYRIALNRWQYGEAADDSGWPLVELNRMVVGEHEIRFNSMADLKGPVDERGLHRWKFWAIDYKTNKTLAEGYDSAEVARLAVEAVTA